MARLQLVLYRDKVVKMIENMVISVKVSFKFDFFYFLLELESNFESREITSHEIK